MSIWLALPVAAVFGAVFSFLLNRLVYAPFQRKGTNLIGMVIISLAVSLVIANVLLPIVGYYSVSYHQNPGATYHVGSIALTAEQFAIIGVAVVVMLAITHCSDSPGWARRCAPPPPTRPSPATAASPPPG